MKNPISRGFLGLGRVRLNPQPTLAMNLEAKKIVIEVVVSKKLATYERNCEVTETDRFMISRLTKEGLSGEEIVAKVLELHKV